MAPDIPDSNDAGRFGRSASMLSAGIGAAGLLTYLFFSLASHNLGATEYGEIVVLWSAVFVTISVAYRPVEQLLSRTIAERRAHGEDVAQGMRMAAALQLGMAATITAAFVLLRDQIEGELLRGDETLYWVLVASVATFGVSFYLRGTLAGNRRFGLLAGILIAEAGARTGFALAVAVGAAGGQATIALGVAAAPLTTVAIVPAVLLVLRRSAPAPAVAMRDEERVSASHGGSFAAAVLVVMLGEQALLNAGPLLINAFDDAAAAGFAFNMLMVVRAPVLVFQGVAISLLPHLTRLRFGGERGEREFHSSIRSTLTAVAAFTVLVLAGLTAVGPSAMQVAFGAGFEYDRLGLMIVAVGMGLYLSATTLNQAALARGAAASAARCWALVAGLFLVWCLLPVVGDEVRRVEVGFTAMAGLLATLLARVYAGATGEGAIEPDSPEEIEARLASADEVG